MSFPSPGDLSDTEIKPTSPELAGRLFTTEPPGKPTFAKCTSVKMFYGKESEVLCYRMKTVIFTYNRCSCSGRANICYFDQDCISLMISILSKLL